ncbi:MAG TPA: GAF domain-containing sensor histidine kinase [Chitinophagaceae bacterium]|nr:GAF domain-containing sensor histidine kinase [Chitinophagaceae bacterium]
MHTSNITHLQADIDAIAKIPVIPSLLEVVCRTTGMGFAAVARVTDERWIACSVRDDISFGLKRGDELQLQTTICNEIRQHGNAVVIDHVAEDSSFARHHTPAMYGFQSYISMPIFRKNGQFFGTLCAIDPKPAQLNNPQVLGMFRLFADLIAFHLQAGEELAATELKLTEEYKTAELRERFIAILGHDLRNPIGAISGSADVIKMISQEPDITRLADIIKTSAYRMQGMIENVLDFARGRLGGAFNLKKKESAELAQTLASVINELQVIWPGRVIEQEINVPVPVSCDSGRIAQLFSNLLGNALSYGLPEHPVVVSALVRNEQFVLSVTNKGKDIAAAELEKLFSPFYRLEVKPGQQGLGLGLYIAAELARAHGGNIIVDSGGGQTVFTFSMPVQEAVHQD